MVNFGILMYHVILHHPWNNVTITILPETGGDTMFSNMYAAYND